jgi:CrcB protein
VTAVAVGLLAGLGAVARYVVDTLFKERMFKKRTDSFPLGILVVNVTGTFLLGLATGAVDSAGLGTGTSTALGVGFCGGYTTWSTFAVDQVDLVQRGAGGRAVLYVVLSVGLGLTAAATGFGVALLF